MANFTYAQGVELIDKITAAYIALEGTSASGLGVGDGTYGMSDKAADIKAIVEGSSSSIFRDADVQKVLASIGINLVSASNQAAIFSMVYSGLLSGMEALASVNRTVDSSIQGLNTMMSWYNYGNAVTYWQMMAPPDWVPAYTAAKGSAPTAKNVYFACRQGETYRGTTFTNALAKYVITAGTGVTTDGYTIPYATYAGGLLYGKWTGGAGSGTVTVTGKDQDNNVETWVLTFAGATGDAVAVPVARSYSLCTDITSITKSGPTDATIYFEARPPSGRTYPPT